MVERNPYAISFGRIPNQYISRGIVIDTIIENLESDEPAEQAFKLTGLKGMGKTVTLTEIEKRMREEKRWIVIGIKSNANITESIVAELYNEVPMITSFVDKELNLSKFGIGITLSKKSPVASIDYALKEILRYLNSKDKRVLITIDEVRKTKDLVDFVQEFQILIREELPIYMIVAGLYEDIEGIENTEGLTFFLRAEKYEMQPLNHTLIRNDYEKTIGVSFENADKMASITMGYPFAYQALGKYMWESGKKEITDEILLKLDEALAEKVYKKMWSELAPRDRYFLRFIAEKGSMSASELLEKTKKQHNDWSEPRKRLSEKGLIDVKTRGQIKVRLPRLNEYIREQEYM